MYKFSSFVALSTIGKKNVQSIQIILLCLFASIILQAQAAGSLDTTFGNGGVVTKDFGDKSAEFIYATAIQADGKIIVGGEINDGYYDDGFLARYNTNGQLDTTFGIRGFVRSPIGGVYSIIILTDGKIIAGNSYGVMRLNPNGQLDASFGSSGITDASLSGYYSGTKSVSVQSDGKIVVVGNRTTNGIYHPVIKRFTAAGQPDATFGANGEVISTATGVATTLAVQPDDKIIVSSYNGGNSQNPTPLIARYTANGQLDTAFGSGGSLPATDFVYSVAIQTDGKIVVGGNGVIRRYSTTGQLDASFGSSGTASGFARSLTIQTDGKIVAGGISNIMRLTAAGLLDANFGGGSGSVSTIGNIYSIAIQPSDGKIVGGGLVQNTFGPDAFLTRFSAAGQLDASFGSGGFIIYNDRNGSETADSIAIQSDGKIVVGGQRFINGNTKGAVTRFTAAGQLDNSFGAGGTFSSGTFSTSNGNYDPFYSVAIQADGKIVAVGYSGITRLTAAGQLDNSFGASGIVSTNGSYKLNIQPDGKILVQNYVSSISSYVLARYTATGQVDNSFGTNGTVPLSNYADAIALQPDGKIIVNSYVPSSGSYILARYTTSGQLDATFGSGGTVSSAYANATAIQPDGKIVVVNYVSSTSSYVLARYTATGQPDASFGTNGTVPLSSFANAIAIQRDGKFILGGGTKITRLTETGQIDFTFGTNGVVSTPINSRYNPIRTIVIQNDDKIVVGGINEPVVNKDADLALLRYNAGPVFDPCTSFSINYGQTFSGSINGGSCVTNGRYNDVYTFSGTLGDQIAVNMDAAFYPAIELINSQGTVVQTVSGSDISRSVRLPSSQGYFVLPAAGTYSIRVSSNFQDTGAYSLSLYKAPPASAPCTYSLSSPRTNVRSGGGVFFIDVLTQSSCPPAAAPNPVGQIYTINSYIGGRLTFSVRLNPGTTDRQDTITVAGQTHTIYQYGNVPPANDLFGRATAISGIKSSPNNPITGYNTNATFEQSEPGHNGKLAAQSVWYQWKATESGFYSFSTSGSGFDTVMAIYACPTTGTCSLTNIEPVGSNDDTTAFDKTSKVNFRAVADTVYYIAIDGKKFDDGTISSGTIQLSFLQYERLYRLYLQNYNGGPSPITPASVVASNGSQTVAGTFISQGVYEFNLPADGTTYYVKISGPSGIVWSVNNFPLGSVFSSPNKLTGSQLNGLTDDSSNGGDNTTSNAQFGSEKYDNVLIGNITPAELALLSVKTSYSRGTNPHKPDDCVNPTSILFNTVYYVQLQCKIQPNTLYDIIPARAGKKFNVPVFSSLGPVMSDNFAELPPKVRIQAEKADTYNISGRVLKGGAGTTVSLAYQPAGNAPIITLQTKTTIVDNAHPEFGYYNFENLLPGIYTLNASQTGFVFSPQPNVVLQTNDATVDIDPQKVCTYEPLETLSLIPAAGGDNALTIKTNDATCEWAAKSQVPWIQIKSGATVGNGSLQFKIESNTGAARSGVIRLNGQNITIGQSAVKSHKRVKVITN